MSTFHASPELFDRLAYHRQVNAPRLARYMGYYRNPMSDLLTYLPSSPSCTFSMRPYRQYQEVGLPTRITGFRVTTDGTPQSAGPLDSQRKEVVIENDIAWRINTMVDFALPNLPPFTSTAAAPVRRTQITRVLNAVLDASGGVALFQQLLLLGAIHGSSYLLLEPAPDLLAALAQRRTTPAPAAPRRQSTAGEPPLPGTPGLVSVPGALDLSPAASLPNSSVVSPLDLGRASGGPGNAGVTGPAVGGNGNGTAVPLQTRTDSTPESAGSGPDIASAEVATPESAAAVLEWARLLRLTALPAPGVLSFPRLFGAFSAPMPVDSTSSSPLEPAQVVLFHDFRPSYGAAASTRQRPASTRAAWLLDRFARWLAPRFHPGSTPASALPTTRGGTDPAFDFDLWCPARWQRYQTGALIEEGPNPLGFVPVIPFINQVTPLAGLDPFDLPGLSEVESLLSLQDELNTRLSDRASRVTMQSFRMYLIKGIDDAAVRPIGPGQMWTTSNLDANIASFGGDMAAPSEDAHINEIREALDKISGVSPVAAGLIRGRLGNLTSAVALKITLIALLARTEKRRTALTATFAVLCRRILEVFDAAGIFSTTPEERGIDVNYPSALPENTAELLADAKAKLELGISRRTVLTELGYAEELPDS